VRDALLQRPRPPSADLRTRGTERTAATEKGGACAGANAVGGVKKAARAPKAPPAAPWLSPRALHSKPVGSLSRGHRGFEGVSAALPVGQKSLQTAVGGRLGGGTGALRETAAERSLRPPERVLPHCVPSVVQGEGGRERGAVGEGDTRAPQWSRHEDERWKTEVLRGGRESIAFPPRPRCRPSLRDGGRGKRDRERERHRESRGREALLRARRRGSR